MTYTPKILALAGSLRKESYNKKLIKIAARGAMEAGGEVTLIDLQDYPLPIYDQDLEEREGLPPSAIALKKLFREHDGILLASPEYNSSVSAVLKNVIDWVSRNETPTERYLSCFIDKAVTLMSASIGGLGGIRGLVHVRSIFSNIYSLVLPKQKTISFASEAFNEQGNLKNPADQKETEDLGRELVAFLRKYKGP